MAGNIKGITIEIGGNTTGLNKALAQVNRESRKTSNELKQVEKALKLDPKNIDLLKQKQELLNKSIGETETKLDALKKAKEQADQDMANGTEVNQEQYRKLQREITITESNLKGLKAESAGSSFREFGAHLDEIGGKLKSTGEKIDKLGGKLTTGVTVPLVAAGTALVNFAMDAETSYAKVGTIIDDTAVSYEEMKSKVKTASDETGIAIADFNEALYSSISAGVDSGKAIDFTTQMSKLAKGGFTETAKAVDVVTTVLNAYGRSAEDAEIISDQLIATQNLGKTTVDELASSMGKVIPTAKNVNIGFADVSAAMALLTKNGIATAEATTYYNSMLNELGKSGSAADTALRELSGKSFKDLVAEGKPVTETLGMLDRYAKDSGKSLSDMFGSAEASKAALTIMSNDGKDYTEMLNSMEDAAGSTQAAFEKMDAAPAAIMQKELNKIKNEGIELGAMLLPIVSDVMGNIGELTKKFSELDEQTKNNILRFAGLAAAAGPVVKIGGNVISTVGKMTSYLGKTAKAMGGATESATLLSKSIMFLGSPTGLAVVATGAVLGLAAAIDHFAMKSLREAREKIDESRQAFNDFAKSMDEAAKSSDNGMQAADKETDVLFALNNELKEIVDSEGKVKEGSEERAQYIIGTLNGALGDQLELENGIVKGYQDQGAEIDNLISKKKAQMQLDAQSTKLDAAQTTYDTGMEDQIKLRSELAKQTDKVKAAQEELDKARELGQRSTVTQESNLRNEKQALQELKSQYNENAGVVDSAYAQIQQIEEAHLAFEQGNYEEIGKILSKRSLVYTAEGKATKASLATQAQEMTGYYEELKIALEKGHEGVDADMVKNAEELAISATREYQKAGGAIGDGIIIGIDESGNPIYQASETLAGKAIDGVKMGFKEVKNVLETLGFEVPATLIGAIARQDAKVQQATIQTLSKINEGITLSQPEIEELLQNLGIETTDELIQTMVGLEPSVYAEAINLLKNLQTASEDKKPEITEQLKQLGIDMDSKLADGIKNNRNKPVSEMYTTGKETNDSGQSGILYKTINMPGVISDKMVASAEAAGRAAHRAAQRKLLDLGDLVIGVRYGVAPAPSVPKLAPELADGGIFNRPTDVKIGETYQKEYVIPVERPATGLPLLKSAAADMGYVLTRPFMQNSHSSSTSYDDHSNINVYPKSEPTSFRGMRQMAREISAEQERKRRSYVKGRGKR